MVGILSLPSVSLEWRKTIGALISLPSKGCAALDICQGLALLVQFLASLLLLCKIVFSYSVHISLYFQLFPF